MQLFEPPEALLSQLTTQQEPCKGAADSHAPGQGQKEQITCRKAELKNLIKDFNLPSISEAIEALVSHTEVCFAPPTI